MEELLAFLPMIGGISIAIIAVIMENKQKRSTELQQQQMTHIISSDQMSLEEVVRSVLQMQLKHHEKDKWMERVIGFFMGLASSLIVSFVFYYLG